MQIGIPAESAAGQTLVAATPKTVAALINLGHRVRVQSGAGAAASYPDQAYTAAGAEIVDDVWTSDLIAKVDPPSNAEIDRMVDGAWLACLLAPARSPDLLEALAAKNITALAMDAVPRISRAQSLDVLSSMANLAGYRAVIEAAHAFGGLFTGQVTAAGKVPPARVFVVGAGVAGLAAIGAAVSLGAQVLAFDVRPEVAEQVESMGAEFVRLEVGTTQRSDGYASELTGDAEVAAAALYDEQARAADIVITTALIPGRPAPGLISADTVAAMKPGSVLVDLAAANGGNIAGTVAGERVVTESGVTLIGYTDLAGRLPTQASQLYGTNMVNLIKLLTPNTAMSGVDAGARAGLITDGTAMSGADAGAGAGLTTDGTAMSGVALDLDDEVIRGMTVTNAGAVTWPPPPISVSAAPVVPPENPDPVSEPAASDPRRRWYLLGLVGVLFALAMTFSPPAFLGHLTVFALAVVVGYYVISHVTHALHTPLMSVTNAISGIICVGALLQVGSANLPITLLSLAGIVVASINIFGGFTVTHRMLGMFRRD